MKQFPLRSPFRRWLDVPPPVASSTPRPTFSGLPLLVVGAGPAGLATLAALVREGVNCEAVELHTNVGGIWDESNPLSSVYSGMNTVTSRSMMHLGSPMPSDWPAYVPQKSVLGYLLSFANQIGLDRRIRFATRFEGASKTERGTWIAELRHVGDNEVVKREFRGIVVATGAFNKDHRLVPTALWDEAVAGGASVIHSSEYQDPSPYTGKRVLVVGIGNSGSDIAAKISASAKRTVLSVRTPPWITPARMFRIPVDRMKWIADTVHLPHWCQVGAFHAAGRLAHRSLRPYGLGTPTHALLDRLPVTDRGIVGAIRDRRVVIRSSVISFADQIAVFEDPRHAREWFDVVIFATGFGRSYPLLAEEPTPIKGGALAFQILHPTEPGLAFMTEVVGPRSCWPIFVEQAAAIAAYFAAEQRGGRHVPPFNLRRSLPTPSFKGKLFAGADGYHLDYRIYTAALRELAAWLSS